MSFCTSRATGSCNLSPEEKEISFWAGAKMRTGRLLALLKKYWRVIPLFLVAPALSPLLLTGTDQGRCAFLLLLIACFWVLELLPLSLTAVLPFLLAPLLRIGTSVELARSYFTDIHFLMVGGVVLSVAMEDTRLSRRFALRVVALLGTRPRWLLLGFMLPSWLLSMWMSNTGTTILMFPFVMAAITEAENAAKQISSGEEAIALQTRKAHGGDDSNEEDHKVTIVDHKALQAEAEKANNHAVCYCLSVAYACNVGGVATLIGTGTNLILVGQLQQIYRISNVITFSNWMAFCFPLSFLSLLLIWLILQLMFVGVRETFDFRKQSPEKAEREARVKQYFNQQLEALGPVSFAEWATMAAFPLVLLLLLTGKLTSNFGWHYLFGSLGGTTVVSDATAMMLVAVLLLMVPNPAANDASTPLIRPNSLGYRPVVCWHRVVERIPVDILLLIGGGLALAKLTKDSKLSDLIGLTLTPFLRSLPTMLTLLVLCFCVIWLTEVTSNMATASVLLPIVAQIAACLGQNPLLFMISLTATCSYAFCLPTATPPNAVVFSSGRVTIPQMAKAGFMLNITFAIIVPFYTQLVGRWVYSVHEMPPWAMGSANRCGNVTVAG